MSFANATSDFCSAWDTAVLPEIPCFIGSCCNGIPLHYIPRNLYTVLTLLCFVVVNLLQWRHKEYDGVSNHQRLECLLNRLFRPRSNKTSKLCVTGLNERNSPVIDVFPAQRANTFDAIIMYQNDLPSFLDITSLIFDTIRLPQYQ